MRVSGPGIVSGNDNFQLMAMKLVIERQVTKCTMSKLGQPREVKRREPPSHDMLKNC